MARQLSQPFSVHKGGNNDGRGYVEKAADAGKVSLLQEGPLRYLLRAVGAGMGLTLVVFVYKHMVSPIRYKSGSWTGFETSFALVKAGIAVKSAELMVT